MTRSFWKGQRVLVTGSDGFIGSHLVEALVGLGATVRAFCLYNSAGSLGWLDKIAVETRNALEVRLGDVRDSRFVEETCEGVETVFHLAALIAIPYSYTAPETFVDTNVRGTLNVLEGARRAGCRRLVSTSTSEVYGTPSTLPILETHPLRAQSPYSATKIAADKLCEAYFSSFGVPVVTLRPFNTYGPRQSARAVLPSILVQLLAGCDELRLGRLDPRRDLTFVADTVEGFVRAGQVEGIEGEVIQLGTGTAYSVSDLIAEACGVLGRSVTVVEDVERVRPSRSEVAVLVSDPGKARSVLGWRPSVQLREGMERTIAWLEQNLDHYESGRYYV